MTPGCPEWDAISDVGGSDEVVTAGVDGAYEMHPETRMTMPTKKR